MRVRRPLRTLLLPFAVTLVVGGTLVVVVMAMMGLLPARLDAATPPPAPTPTAVPSASGAPRPVGASPEQLFTPEPLPEGELALVCEDNARRFSLAHPDATPVLNVSRVAVLPDAGRAYLVADGRLLRVSLDALEQESELLFTEQVEPANRLVGGFPIQELSDVAYDADGGALLALDKSGRVFRYMPGGAWDVVLHPTLAPDDQADPSYMALAANGGTGYLLDADLHQVWRFSLSGDPSSAPQRFYGSGDLRDAVDIAVSDDWLLALDLNGNVSSYLPDEQQTGPGVASGAELPLSLKMDGGQVTVVDGLRREMLTFEVGNVEAAEGFRFAFAGMGLLRDVAFDGQGRLLAVADNKLAVYAPSNGNGRCPPLEDGPPPLRYYDVDLRDALAGFRYPIADARLPGVPRAYPGARRLYRAGVHHGIDIHPWDVPGEIDIGEPVYAMQEGVVTRADVDYREMTETEFTFLTEQAQSLGLSLPGTLDRIGGRQVHISHVGGVSTRYLHLDSVEEGIEPGVEVRRGQLIGTVGVSGTGREADAVFVAAHLHMEIWIGDHYLGEGLSLRETMWLWRQVFPEQDVTPP